VAETARRLDVHEHMLRKWQRQFEPQGEQAFPGKGQQTAVEEENRRDILPLEMSCFLKIFRLPRLMSCFHSAGDLAAQWSRFHHRVMMNWLLGVHPSVWDQVRLCRIV